MLPATTATDSSRRSVLTTWKIVALAGLTMLCWSFIFASTYTRAFYWDDLHFVRPYSLSELASTFHGPNDPDGIETVALRPLATILFGLQGTLLGEHVILQRLFMAALMGGLLVATGLLLREAGLSLRHIAVVFALFASSRVFASVILWLTLGTLILCYIFMMLSALCYVRWIDQQGRRLLFLTVGFAALAVFTREEAYTLPAVLTLVGALARRPGHWRPALAGAAAVAAVMAVHVLLRRRFLPDAPPIRMSFESLTTGFWPSLQSAWLPGGLTVQDSVDLLLRDLWQGFLGALILVFAFAGTSRARLAVLGLCVLALILCTPSLAVARSFGIALPSLAFLTAISVAIFEIRGAATFPRGYGRWLLRPVVSVLLVLGLALGIGAGIRRSRYVADAQHENSVERIIRDGYFLFDLYGRPATIPAQRREAGLERLATLGIRSREDLQRLQQRTREDDHAFGPGPSRSRLFTSKYDDLDY